MEKKTWKDGGAQDEYEKDKKKRRKSKKGFFPHLVVQREKRHRERVVFCNDNDVSRAERYFPRCGPDVGHSHRFVCSANRVLKNDTNVMFRI